MSDEPIREVMTIRLLDPLPCSIWKPGAPCSQPATVAYAWPATHTPEWPIPGLWTLQPVCAECAARAAQAHEVKP